MIEKTDLYCQELQTLPQPTIGKILVTGATGYVGGRLVPELLARGYHVRVMVRAFSSEYQSRWPGAEIVVGDALDVISLASALEGIHTAYYLIHSLLGGHKKFAELDIRSATNFRLASAQQNVSRIIYLGGLGDIHSRLSSHLRSRQEVCAELMRGSTIVTALRAAIIIGSGSASFEMIEHLIRKLPIIFLPSWTETKCQPIAVRNVIAYLVGILETPATDNHSYDIGGPDILSYRDILHLFADILGVKRLFIRMPIYSLPVYSYLVSLFTPVAHSIIFCLFDSAANTVICQNNEILSIVKIELLPYREAVLRALSRVDQDRIRTRWSDAYPPAHELAIRLEEMDRKELYIKSASLMTKKSAESLFNSICRIGGKSGWFNTNWLWKLRGMLDKILTGVGSMRGRIHPFILRQNDVIDFWRVEDIVPNQRLLLRAEMKLPGLAWLEFSTDKKEDGLNTLTVTAYYQASGFWGKVYWYTVYPFHSFIFQDLIEQIEQRSLET